MKTQVLLPKWGMGMEEGTIARWLKGVGDKVRKGEPIVEIESAKATQEVEAPVSGILVNVLVSAGETAAVYTEIASIEEGDGE